MTESMLTDVLTFLFGIGVLFTMTKLGVAFFNRKRPAGPSPDVPALEARLTRIEQIVESTSIEVERVTEAQRYLLNVFTQRPADPAALPRSGGRVTTPH